jgi:pentatricopeptide repeat protein
VFVGSWSAYEQLCKGGGRKQIPSSFKLLWFSHCGFLVGLPLLKVCPVSESDTHVKELTASLQVTYGVLMNGYCNRGDLKRSLGLLEDMRSQKLQPNEVIYNTLLKGYAKKGDIAGVKQVKPHSPAVSSEEGALPLISFDLVIRLGSRTKEGVVKSLARLIVVATLVWNSWASGVKNCSLRKLCQRRWECRYMRGVEKYRQGSGTGRAPL